jgi:WD40 repeat protein
MKDTQSCPACGAVNPARRPVCRQCGRFLHQEPQAGFESATPTSPAPEPANAFAGPPPQPSALTRQRFLERPQVKIVRPSNRRKFLVGLLGGAAIVAIGSTGWDQLVQNVRVSLNTKDYPYHIGDDLVSETFSPDLSLMAMVKVGEEDEPDTKLYIWDYQRQHMTALPTGPSYGDPACVWSPDNKYLLYQAHHITDDSTSLDMWDMRTQQKIRTYTGDDYSGFSKIHWSPSGSQIALLIDDGTFVVMDPARLAPLFTFKSPAGVGAFAWSPDGQKVAFLIDDSDNKSTWGMQIWDLQTREMATEVIFQRRYDDLSQNDVLWSPDGQHVVVLARGQLRVIEMVEPLTSYALNDPKEATKFAWSPNSKYLVVNTWGLDRNSWDLAEDTFEAWDVVTRKVARSYNRSANDDPAALGWSSDGKRIIVIGTLYRQENWNWP